MKYHVGVTVSPEYPVNMDKVKAVLNNCALIDEIDMPFRPLSVTEAGCYIEKLKPYDALLVRSGILSADILKHLSNLKIICVHGAGYDQIDITEAAKQNIPVLNTPGANANAVVELTFGLMLGLQRQLLRSALIFQYQNDWEKAKCCGHELYGKTLGLLGLGKIGYGVAQRALAFGMNVKVYDPYLRYLPEENIIVSQALDDMLSDSDIVSLHAPLTPETHHIINKNILAKMKRGSFLINTSRGGLINEHDLYDSLINGHIGGAALDVFEFEPVTNNRLRNLSNIIMTPHIGGSTQEALENVAMMASEQIRIFLENHKIYNKVN